MTVYSIKDLQYTVSSLGGTVALFCCITEEGKKNNYLKKKKTKVEPNVFYTLFDRKKQTKKNPVVHWQAASATPVVSILLRMRSSTALSTGTLSDVTTEDRSPISPIIVVLGQLPAVASASLHPVRLLGDDEALLRRSAAVPGRPRSAWWVSSTGSWHFAALGVL